MQICLVHQRLKMILGRGRNLANRKIFPCYQRMPNDVVEIRKQGNFTSESILIQRLAIYIYFKWLHTFVKL